MGLERRPVGVSWYSVLFLLKYYVTSHMALKRLPVLFFVAESTAKGRLQPRKGLREGSGTEKRTQKSVTL